MSMFNKYRIVVGGVYELDSDRYAPLSANLEIERNKAGSMTLVLLPDNPIYDVFELHKTKVDVYFQGQWKWGGVCSEISVDFFNRKTVSFVGILALLNDAIQRPTKFWNTTLYNFFATLLDFYNAQVGTEFQIHLSVISGFNDVPTFDKVLDYCTTMEAIQKNIIDVYGGYIKIIKSVSPDAYYLNYYEECPNDNSHIVQIGMNLMDLVKSYDADGICTALIPLGAKTGTQSVEGIDDRVTIESVNSGRDYLLGTAVGFFGNIWKVNIWDDITDPAELKTIAQDYLDTEQWSNITIDASAVDLGRYAQDTYGGFWLYDSMIVESAPHGIRASFDLTKLSIDFLHPASSKFTLGDSKKQTLTEQVASIKGGNVS